MGYIIHIASYTAGKITFFKLKSLKVHHSGAVIRYLQNFER